MDLRDKKMTKKSQRNPTKYTEKSNKIHREIQQENNLKESEE